MLMTLSLVLRALATAVKLLGKCVGIVMYADDILLISATCNGLSRLIEIGEQEMAWLDMHLNARK